MSGYPWGSLLIRPALIVLLVGAAIGASVIFAANGDERKYFRVEGARLIPSSKADAHLICKVAPDDWRELSCSDLRSFRLGQTMNVTLDAPSPSPGDR